MEKIKSLGEDRLGDRRRSGAPKLVEDGVGTENLTGNEVVGEPIELTDYMVGEPQVDEALEARRVEQGVEDERHVEEVREELDQTLEVDQEARPEGERRFGNESEAEPETGKGGSNNIYILGNGGFGGGGGDGSHRAEASHERSSQFGECKNCEGTGKVFFFFNCRKCRGSGMVEVARKEKTTHAVETTVR